MSDSQSASFENPFSARFVRPGAIPFIFPAGISLDGLIARWEANSRRGEICGPHGTGKSTLLVAFIEALEARGLSAALTVQRAGQRRLPVGWIRDVASRGAQVLVIDGYEQLGWVDRWRLNRFCTKRGMGIVVTAHKPMGFPPLYCTSVDLTLASEVVSRLLGERDWRPSEHAIEQALTAYRGNLREALFALYDDYQREQSRLAAMPQVTSSVDDP